MTPASRSLNFGQSPRSPAKTPGSSVGTPGPEMETFLVDVEQPGEQDEEQDRRERRMYTAMIGLPDDIRRWTVGDTCSWLAGIGMEEHIAAFVYHEISGPVLADLNSKILKEDLGIERVGHIWLISKAREVAIVTLRDQRQLDYPDLIGPDPYPQGGDERALVVAGAVGAGGLGAFTRQQAQQARARQARGREGGHKFTGLPWFAVPLALLSSVTGFASELEHFLRGGLLHQIQNGCVAILGVVNRGGQQRRRRAKTARVRRQAKELSPSAQRAQG